MTAWICATCGVQQPDTPRPPDGCVPKLVPLDEATVLEIAWRVEPFAFDRVHRGWWGRVVLRDGGAAVRRSADRYVARLRGERPAT